MTKASSKHSLSKYAGVMYEPDDLVPIYYEKNSCGYRWGIPFKNFGAYEALKKPYSIDDLLALEAQLLDILVLQKFSIDFKHDVGIQKLEVAVRSSETEDKQLLHKLTAKFQENDTTINRDNIPGTNNDDHE